jgi:hypothetical protein
MPVDHSIRLDLDEHPGSMKAFTSSIDAGRMVPKTSPCARPICSQSAMLTTHARSDDVFPIARRLSSARIHVLQCLLRLRVDVADTDDRPIGRWRSCPTPTPLPTLTRANSRQ